MPRLMVAASDVTHFAGTHQIIQRADSLLLWCPNIKRMDKVNVNMFCPEPRQGTFHLTHNMVT